MKDFTVVYETDMIFGDYLTCNHCNERVERGIASVSKHWLNCPKNSSGVITAKNDWERKILDSWSVNVEKA